MLHSIQLEKYALNGLIQHTEVLTDIDHFINEQVFVAKPHDLIFSCIRSSFFNNEKIDKVLLAQKLTNLGISFKEDVSIFDYIESISFAPITIQATIDAAKELVKLKALRDIEKTCETIKKHVNKSASQELEKTITEVDSLYSDKINSFDAISEPEDLFADIYEIIENTGNNPIEETGLIWPYPEFNRLYGGARGGNIYSFASPPGVGKALEENTEIPTPEGFTKIKDLNIGDDVFAVDGTITKVIGKKTWNNRNIYKIVTNDRCSILCDEKHEWNVSDIRVNPKKFLNIETQSLTESIGEKFIFRLPEAEALKLPIKDLPIDPYILGTWLGDGSSQTPQITNIDDFIIDKWADYARDLGLIVKVGFVNKRKMRYKIKSETLKKGANLFLNKLKELNLIYNKHIPQIYLRASIEQRTALLQGLIDTDGSVSKKGLIRFTNTNKELINGIVELVHSLGIKVYCGKTEFRKGVNKNQPYEVRFMFENGAALPRKRKLCKNRVKKHRYIKSIPLNIRANTVCIEVAHTSHIFLCGRGMIPTHNSTFLDYTGIEMGKINECPVLILDTELITKEVKYRTAAAISSVPLWALETGNWRKSPQYLEKVRTILKNAKGQYKTYHYHVGNKNVDEVISIIRRWYLSVVGRGKKCIVIYDYLKLTGEKLSNNWAEHQALGEKIDKFKRLAEECDFPFLTAIQTNRSGENLGRNSQDLLDNGSVISQTSRLQWFCTYLGIFRRRTEDEVLLDTKESGSHKLIEIKARYQGKNAAGHQDLFKRTFPDGKIKFVRNFINFNIDNFKVDERGSLKDSIVRQNAQFLVRDEKKDENNKNAKVYIVEDTL